MVKRAFLESEVARLDTKLAARRVQIERSRSAVEAGLRQTNPLFWLGGSALAGYLLGRLDLGSNIRIGHSAYRVAAGLSSGFAGSLLF